MSFTAFYRVFLILVISFGCYSFLFSLWHCMLVSLFPRILFTRALRILSAQLSLSRLMGNLRWMWILSGRKKNLLWVSSAWNVRLLQSVVQVSNLNGIYLCLGNRSQSSVLLLLKGNEEPSWNLLIIILPVLLLPVVSLLLGQSQWTILCHQPPSKSGSQTAVAWLPVSTQATQLATCGHLSTRQGQKPAITRCRPGSPQSRLRTRPRPSRKPAWPTRWSFSRSSSAEQVPTLFHQTR